MSVDPGVVVHEDRPFDRGNRSVGGVCNAFTNEALLACPPGFENAVAGRGLGFGGLCRSGCNPGVNEKDLNEMVDEVSFSADSGRDGNASFLSNVYLQGNDIANLICHVDHNPLDFKTRNSTSEVAGPSKYKMEILNKVNAARKKRDAISGYAASSLVWGKIRSHPWWPGQIFDPADSSKEALRHYKDGRLLVAYFGDGTFAWNEITQLKPFQSHFARMENLGDMETFYCAVDCALDEVSRRVEFGLSCRCLPEDVYDDIQSQIVENSGIYKKTRRRDFGDECSSVECFVPSKLVSYLKESANFSKGSIDRLELVKSIAQLTSFCRWKGYRKPPVFTDFGGMLDNKAKLKIVDGSEAHMVAANNAHYVFPSKIEINEDRAEHLCKRKRRPDCSLTARQKKKKMSVMMEDNELFVSHKHAKANRKPKHKVATEAAYPKSKIVSKSRKKKVDRINSTRDAYKTPAVGRSFVSGSLSPDELFTQLSSTAIDPMNNQDHSISLVKFFSQFRNSSCLNRPISAEANKSLEEESIEKSDKKMPVSEHVENSYWTDRIVEESRTDKSLMDSHDELARVLAEHTTRAVLPILGSEKDPQLHTLSDLKTQDTGGNHESAEGVLDIPGKHKDEMMRTALLLKFSEQNPVPSVIDLNNIFRCYGALHESETKIMKKSVAKVIFKRSCDAEAAFSSAGKYSSFGPSLISYRLKYLTAKPMKKRRKKAAPTFEQGNPITF